ncbi:hypothetical protein Mame01_20390 [Microbispora amethystogenes]|nr:hypothetical protein Mame01_20390 [Microbispora amethystogenes]
MSNHPDVSIHSAAQKWFTFNALEAGDEELNAEWRKKRLQYPGRGLTIRERCTRREGFPYTGWHCVTAYTSA